MTHVPFSSAEAIAAGVEHMQESYTLSCHQEPVTALCVSGVSLFSAGRVFCHAARVFNEGYPSRAPPGRVDAAQ